MQVDHRPLEDVRRRALDGHVDGDPLGRRPDLAVAAVDVRHQSPPPEQRRHDTGLPRLLQGLIEKPADPGESREIGVDELLRRLRRDPDVLRQSERRLAIEQGVVDDLGAPPQFVRAETAVAAEHLERRPIVNVLQAPERLDELLVA